MKKIQWGKLFRTFFKKSFAFISNFGDIRKETNDLDLISRLSEHRLIDEVIHISFTCFNLNSERWGDAFFIFSHLNIEYMHLSYWNFCLFCWRKKKPLNFIKLIYAKLTNKFVISDCLFQSSCWKWITDMNRKRK